jgi:hypothetical protein
MKCKDEYVFGKFNFDRRSTYAFIRAEANMSVSTRTCRGVTHFSLAKEKIPAIAVI